MNDLTSDLVKRLQDNGHVLLHIETQANWINKQAARIAELETALRYIRDMEPDREAWSIGVARAALEGKGNE